MGETCCCGCCSVKMGTKILAVLGIIGSILGTGINILSIILWTQKKLHISQTIDKVIVGLIFYIVYFILSCLLLNGAIKKKYRRCLLWLYWNFFMIALSIVSFIFYAVIWVGVLFSVSEVAEPLILGIVVGIAYIIGMAINIYFVNVVRRFVNELLDY